VMVVNIADVLRIVTVCFRGHPTRTGSCSYPDGSHCP
jgi:hypothetical protein